MMRALSVVGFHKAGKTKVVEAIIRELTRRGYRVGTVKHITERDFTIDHPGKDTWVHAQAGAKLVVSVAPEEVARIEKRQAKLEEILEGLYWLDFVIVEGFKDFRGLAKVVVGRTEDEASKLLDEFTIACVGIEGLTVPTFGLDRVKELVDIVEKKAYPLLSGLNCEQCGFESCDKFAAAVVSGEKPWDGCPAMHGRVTITVDGRKISLNPFVQEIFAKTLLGMVSSLKRSEGERVEIEVMRSAR